MHTLPSPAGRLCSPTLVGVHQRLPHLVCQSHAGVHSQTKGATHNARRRLAHMLRVTAGRTEQTWLGVEGGGEAAQQAIDNLFHQSYANNNTSRKTASPGFYACWQKKRRGCKRPSMLQ